MNSTFGGQRSPWVWAAFFSGVALLTLAADRYTNLLTQSALGVSMWLVLAAAAAALPAPQRCALLGLTVSAICAEIFFVSAGIYSYRLENIPAYVPAGHACIFLSCWLAASRAGAPRWLWALVLALSAAWTAWGLAQPTPDLFGLYGSLLYWGLLLSWRAQRSVMLWMFVGVGAAEWGGSLMGAWVWAETLGWGLEWGVGNPPSGVIGFYVLVYLSGALAGQALYSRLAGRLNPDDPR